MNLIQSSLKTLMMATDICIYILFTFTQLFKLSQASSSQLLFQPSSPLALFLVLLLSKSIKDPGLSFLAGALFFLLGLELQGNLFIQEFMSKTEASMIVTSWLETLRTSPTGSSQCPSCPPRRRRHLLCPPSRRTRRRMTPGGPGNCPDTRRCNTPRSRSGYES